MRNENKVLDKWDEEFNETREYMYYTAWVVFFSIVGLSSILFLMGLVVIKIVGG